MSVFQLHGGGADGAVVMQKKLRRDEFFIFCVGYSAA